MADLRRLSLRVAVAVAAVVFGIVEVQGLFHLLSSQARLQESVTRAVRQPIRGARPGLAGTLLPGGEEAWETACQEALDASLAEEVEVFEETGGRLLALPVPSPVRHWPTPEQLRRLRDGELVSLGPQGQATPRLLTYAAFDSGGGRVLLRLSTAVPALVDDLRERRMLLIGHGVSLVALVLAASLALYPAGRERPSSPLQAFGAYEEAMEQLRSRGEAQTREHATERRRMEGEIREKEAMARAGELAAGIVHEVRNGLGTIVGYARLSERAASSSEGRDSARAILQECDTLETVIRRLMDYVRRESLELLRFDLGRTLSRVAAREGRGGPGGEVSPPTGGVSIVGDEGLLERAFENLVRNAREAAGTDGHVWIKLTEREGTVTVVIADDGPGLPSEERGQLRPFRSTKTGGLGLGLPIALKIVRLHRGELTMGDRTPRGLEVTVSLPEAGPPA